MSILDMTPPHLLSWCQTRIAHFLKSCNIFNEMLAAVYDNMYTKGIQVDERDLLFTTINVYIIKIMADLQPLFFANFLHQTDKSDILVSEVGIDFDSCFSINDVTKRENITNLYSYKFKLTMSTTFELISPLRSTIYQALLLHCLKTDFQYQKRMIFTVP